MSGGARRGGKKKIEKEKRKCTFLEISELPQFPKKITSD